MRPSWSILAGQPSFQATGGLARGARNGANRRVASGCRPRHGPKTGLAQITDAAVRAPHPSFGWGGAKNAASAVWRIVSMRCSSLLIAALAVAGVDLGSSQQVAADNAAVRLTPPTAARKPVRVVTHGIERIDEYAWLRDPNWRAIMQDPSRLAPDIRTHLEAENRYAEALIAPLSVLRAKLLEELKGRIEPDESGVPLPDGPFAYWRKYLPGAEHPRMVRARGRADPSKFCSTEPCWRRANPFSRSGMLSTARITACTPIRSIPPAPRATTCAFATSARGAICRRSSRRRPASRGRLTAERCFMCGSTTICGHASSTGIASAPILARIDWCTKRRISASRFRWRPRAAGVSW